jgi:acetyl-CoA carboxylase carboxyltransferase component
MAPPMRDLLSSPLPAGDPEADARRAANLALLEVLDEDTARAAAGGGEKYVERHRARGKLLARERIDLLLDEDAPFLELMALAGWGTSDPLGGAMVCGIGPVEGVECMVTATDPTVRGGSISPTGVQKMLRALEICLRNRLPLVNLVESGGAELPKQADVFMPGGNQFKLLTRMSAAGIPVITAVFGSSTAGGAYLPGMSDHTVLVRGEARVYLGGPPLVKMAIDEDADEEELGGAEMHARTSGLADHLAADEPDALRKCRQIVADLGFRKLGPGATGAGEPPGYDGEELLSIAPVDLRQPLDVRTVLARVLDGSRFDEFKPLYGSQLVCGWGAVHGFEIGVLGNNGILFSEESEKGAQFIQLANRSSVPLLFVQNITGFMVGTRYEQGGIIKDGAKLINAVSNSTVPHVTLMVGASYGAGNYGMSGRAYEPRFVFTWPGHRIAVMGPKQLAGVMSIITRGRDPAAIEALEAQVEAESEARYATGRIWDDGIIDPRQTRTVLGLALSAVHSAPVEGTSNFGVWRM